MKTQITNLSIITLIIISLVSSKNINAQCQASFTYIDNGSGNYSFTNTSTGSFLMYYWTFGDGNNSFSSNSVNTYLNNGTYEVCLSIFDSISQCQSTFCDSILVTSASSCNLNTPYYTIDSICNYYFTANNNGSSFFWNFGNGNTSTQQNPIHNYSTNGWYYYCLTVDSCPAICDSIYVGCVSSNPCNLNQPSYIMDSLCYMNFYANNNGSTYYWNFGDGNTSTQQNPTHGYSSPGWYWSCLTVDSCPQVCDSIYIGCSPSSINDYLANNPTGIKIYPNPIKNNAVIEFEINNHSQVEISVINIVGETVATLFNDNVSFGKTKLNWNTSNLKNGVYLVQIKTGTSNQVQKVILNK